MSEKKGFTILAALFLGVMAVTAPVFAEEVAPIPEIPKKPEAKTAETKKTDAKKKTGASQKTAAVKKAKSTAKKNEAKTAEPSPRKPAPEPTPTTPVSGGDAASPTAVAMKNGAEVSSVTVAPLPYVTRKVSALVESSPSSCDIEVDGVYVGATPVELHLKEGVHFVRISRGGYIPWEKTVKAYNGVFIYATLTQESSRKIEVNESVKAK